LTAPAERPSRRVRRGALAVVCGWALLALAVPGTAGAQDAQQLTIAGVSSSPDRSTVVVRAPAGTPEVGPSDGKLIVDGNELPTETSPLVGDDQVLVVVDTGVPEGLFRPLQGALIELVQRLPEDASVVVADTASGTAVDTGTDRTVAGEALASLSQGEGGELAGALETARSVAGPGAHPTVIVTASPEAVPADPGGNAAAPVWIALLTDSVPSSGPVARAAEQPGTQVVNSSDPVGLLPSLGGIADDLGGRYVLSTPGPIEGETLEVQLPGASGTLSATTPLDGVPAAGPTDGSAEDDGGLPWWVLALAAIAVVAVLGGLVFLLVRSRRSRGPKLPVPSAAPPQATSSPASTSSVPTAGAALFGAASPAAAAPAPPLPPERPAPAAPLFGSEAAPVPAAPAPTGPPPPNGVPLFGPGAAPPAPPIPPLPAVDVTPPATNGVATDLTALGEAPPEPHVFSVEPQPIDLRRPNAPSADAGLGIAERDAIEVVEELARRRADGEPAVPADLYLALEAAASTWLVDEAAAPTDVVRCLSPEGPDDGPVAAHLWALRRCLTLPASTGGRDAADRAVEVLRSPSPAHVVRLPPPPSTAGHAPSLQGLVTEAALIERVERYGTLGPDAARTVLSTGPARTGLLEGVPLVISPSLILPEGAQPGAAEPLGSRSLAMLLAVTDAAARMLDAEVALREALPEVGARGRAVAEGTRFDAEAVAAVVAGQVVLTPGAVATQLGDPSAVDELVALLTGAGLLRQEATGSDGSPLWVVPLLFDRVTAPFAEPGLVTERATSSQQRTSEVTQVRNPA
jgi:hypothetical protein